MLRVLCRAQAPVAETSTPYQTDRLHRPEALPRARRPPARMVARVPTGVPDRTAFRAGASRQTAPRTRRATAWHPYRARSHQKPVPRAPPFKARVVARVPTGVPDRTAFRAKRFAPDAAQNAPRASRKRLPHATSLQHDHRPGPDSTATPGHCVTATARAPVAPDDAGAQRRSSVAVAPPGHIVCTQVSCESASPFSFTPTQADTDAARPAFTP